MLDFVQQLVSGIALGFVLVCKATEVVNFAQGDLSGRWVLMKDGLVF